MEGRFPRDTNGVVYSKASVSWIEEVKCKEGVEIRSALSDEGEYAVSGVGHVDGYCASTNTVYEYHGDYWHGNPNRYDSNNINSVTGTTFGELFYRTVTRDRKLLSLGYKLVVQWETEYEGYLDLVTSGKEVPCPKKEVNNSEPEAMGTGYRIIWMSDADYERCIEMLDSYQRILDRGRENARKARGSTSTLKTKAKPVLNAYIQVDASTLPEFLIDSKALAQLKQLKIT